MGSRSYWVWEEQDIEDLVGLRYRTGRGLATDS